MDIDGVQEDEQLAMASNGFNAEQLTIHEWWDEFTSFVDKMFALGVPWGFKEPRLGVLVFKVLAYLPGAPIIRCNRPRRNTVESMVKKLGWKEAQAERFYDISHISLDFALAGRNHLRVSYSKGRRLNESDLVEHISRMQVVRVAI